MHKYNSYFPDSATPESLTADREAMLREIFGKVGKDVFIEPPLNIDYGCNISLGDGFYSNFKLSFFPPLHRLILTLAFLPSWVAYRHTLVLHVVKEMVDAYSHSLTNL